MCGVWRVTLLNLGKDESAYHGKNGLSRTSNLSKSFGFRLRWRKDEPFQTTGTAPHLQQLSGRRFDYYLDLRPVVLIWRKYLGDVPQPPGLWRSLDTFSPNRLGTLISEVFLIPSSSTPLWGTLTRSHSWNLWSMSWAVDFYTKTKSSTDTWQIKESDL